MTALWAETALLPEGWAAGVRLEIDAAGDLAAVQAGGHAAGAERLVGAVLPGIPNVHSHAFQRAMAGLAERLEPGEASFWTWRRVMYRFLERIGPDELSAIAAQLYVEMLEAGYTAVGEFHYLHHRPDGRAYDDPAELSWAILQAQRTTGIGLSHLPVLYLAGGFGGASPEVGQRRFLHDLDAFARLLEAVRSALAGDPDLRLGIAPHSLRAVPDDALLEALAALDRIDPDAPIHIHVAEQAKEVRDCLEWCGRRPVAHLLEVAPVDPRWCLIHATHMDEDETAALAQSGAVAGLCPTTEANLGDGLFNLAAWLDGGGRFGIGSDSHVSVSPIEELRWLEYGQRLTTLRRLVAASETEPHCGARLWRAALAGGAQALGRRIGRLAPGYRADLIRLDPNHPLLCGRSGDLLLDALVFSGNANPVQDVMVGGRWRVREGRHLDRDRIATAYRQTIARLN
ncbi:MAG TPA: formimidoylglutamate deiminase [Geminicoccaceae bacterium]|nr:formimidoylglutamate deiminase [Geminicoccaceae bacterium]